MTPKNTVDPEGDDSLGVLDDTASSDTIAFGPLGGTEQVSVALPTGGEDDDLVQERIVAGEVVSDLIIDTSAVADEDTLARINQDAQGIVIELPVEADAETTDAVADVDAVADDDTIADAVAEAGDDTDADDVVDIVDADDAADIVDADEVSVSGDDAAEATAPEETASEETAEIDASGLSPLESAVAVAKAELRAAMSPTPTKNQIEPRPRGARTAEENRPVATDDSAPAARPDADTARVHAEPARPASEVALSSKRLDDLSDSARESADLLTADRLLDPSRIAKPEPEGTWSHLLYAISGGRINIGDGRRARERKALTARIAASMAGTARFVPVLSRKGGVGKTTVTALLGMALADARDDRVIAVDANPDRGTLAERVVGSQAKSVRDLVRSQNDIRGFHDISALVARDETRLDVLASDADPRVSEAFGDVDYRDVAAVAAQYYSLVLTDSGTGIVHSVMEATLQLADRIVVVSGLSVDEARLASETLTWLETNGYAQLARDAIVVLNQSTPGAPLVRLSELEAHFSTRASQVLRIPYDAQIAGGGPIDFGSLQPETRRAAREIAAVLVEGLRTKAA